MSKKTETRCECGNCEWTGPESKLGCELGDVPDLYERLDPGGVVPAGECPECGALAYPVDSQPPTNRDKIYAEILRIQRETRDQVTVFLRHCDEGGAIDSRGALLLLREVVLINAINCVAAAERGAVSPLYELAPEMAELLQWVGGVLNMSDSTHPDFKDSCADCIEHLWQREAAIRIVLLKLAGQWKE